MDQNINAIYMWDVSNSIMESLIRYIYIGEVTVHEGECTHFCNIAERLELIGKLQEFNDEDLIANGEKTSDTEEVQNSGNEEDLDTDTERVNEKTCETEKSENSVIDDDLDAETEAVSEETRKAKEFQHSVKIKSFNKQDVINHFLKVKVLVGMLVPYIKIQNIYVIVVHIMLLLVLI